MTPKEKAEELVGRYAMYLRANLMHDEEANEDAKQCALIAVDEIIKANPTDSYSDAFIGTKSYDNSSYWEQVKQEIKKL